jgi:hypothetical protein
MRDSSHAGKRYSGRWGWWLLAGLLLLGCCVWGGLGAWLFAPLTPFLANRLSYVQGKAEVIAPAQWRPGGILSPNGRYMVMGWNRNGSHERFVWDLTSGAQHPFQLGGGGLCWLNPEQFAILDSATNSYFLIHAPDATIMPATLIIPWKHGISQTKERWQAAEQLYVLTNFLYSGSTVVSIEQGQPYVYINLDSTQDLDPLFQDIPHVRIPEYCNNPPEGVPVYSPDGRFYTQLSKGESAHVLIYTREGELVAEASKTGWNPRLMGWAHDSSGVYFQMLISGGAASTLVPYQPIFKLSPLTEEEARWAWVWTILPWIIGLALVAIGGWLWQRRKRSRVT